jgi:hypothetical protein
MQAYISEEWREGERHLQRRRRLGGLAAVHCLDQRRGHGQRPLSESESEGGCLRAVYFCTPFHANTNARAMRPCVGRDHVSRAMNYTTIYRG